MDARHDRDSAAAAPRRHLLGGGDARLVAAARAGSEDAFAAIVRRHERALRGYAAKLLRGSGHDPEDVVQDVFVRAHAALASDDRRDLDLKPWLYRMTRNRVIDLLRRRADLSLDDDRAAEPVAAPSADPAHAFGRRDALRVLLADVAQLPDAQRNALLMRELDGLSHQAVAAELDITPQATRMLVLRARDNLVKAAAARDATCGDIRADLAGAHDARRRLSEHARRHVRGCADCRSYRRQLDDVRRRVALMHPGPAILGILGLAKLGGAGAVAGGGKTAAALATASVVVTAGVAGTQRPGRTSPPRDPAPSQGHRSGGPERSGSNARAGRRPARTPLVCEARAARFSCSVVPRARRSVTGPRCGGPPLDSATPRRVPLWTNTSSRDLAHRGRPAGEGLLSSYAPARPCSRRHVLDRCRSHRARQGATRRGHVRVPGRLLVQEAWR